MFTGPRIQTQGLKLHIDPANTKQETQGNQLKSIGRVSQLENTTLSSRVDNKKKSKTATLDGINSRISFNEVSIGTDWSAFIVFRTDISTSSPAFKQTLFGNTNTNSPGIIEIGNQTDHNGFISTYISISYINGSNNIDYVKFYISPFLTRYVPSKYQDSFWVDNPIKLTITFEVTMDGGIYRIYLDGELKDQKDLSNYRSDNSINTNLIGSQGNFSKQFSGDIFISSIYDKTLNSNDIKATFDAFKTRFNKLIKRRYFTLRSLWYNKYDNGDYELYEKFNEEKSFSKTSYILLESHYPTYENYGKNPNRGASLVDFSISENGDIILGDYKEEKSTGKFRNFNKNKDYYLNIVRKHINQN